MGIQRRISNLCKSEDAVVEMPGGPCVLRLGCATPNAVSPRGRGSDDGQKTGDRVSKAQQLTEPHILTEPRLQQQNMADEGTALLSAQQRC
jgi:hypothetical protein